MSQEIKHLENNKGIRDLIENQEIPTYRNLTTKEILERLEKLHKEEVESNKLWS